MADAGLTAGFGGAGIGGELPLDPEPGQTEDDHGGNRTGQRDQDIGANPTRMLDAQQARQDVIEELAGTKEGERHATGQREEALHRAERRALVILDDWR